MNLSRIIGEETEEELVDEPTVEQPTIGLPTYPADERYTRTYSSFGGGDIVFYCSGEAFGEVQSYSVDESTGILSIDFAVFEIERIIDSINLLNESGRALVRYMNEYGNQMYVVIEGITFDSRSFRHSVDDMVMIITARFEFESLDMFPGRPYETYADILPNNFFT